MSDFCSARVGGIFELKAAAWLLEQGYEVFKNMMPTGAADLVIFKDGEPEKINVKKAPSVTKDGHPRVRIKQLEDCRKMGVEVLYGLPNNQFIFAQEVCRISSGIVHTCRDCGEVFRPSSSGQRYCSTNCLEAAFRKRNPMSPQRQILKKENEVGLTHRQAELLYFIEEYMLANKGVSPSLDEIAEGLSISSRTGACSLVKMLEKKGAIRRRPGHFRGIELVQASISGDLAEGSDLQSVSTSTKTVIGEDQNATIEHKVIARSAYRAGDHNLIEDSAFEVDEVKKYTPH